MLLDILNRPTNSGDGISILVFTPNGLHVLQQPK